MMINKHINQQNWGHSHYRCGELQALIALGGAPASNDQISILYNIVVLDEEYREYFSKDFNDLDLALQYINKNYSDWDFITLTETKSESSDSGCGSCTAH